MSFFSFLWVEMEEPGGASQLRRAARLVRCYWSPGPIDPAFDYVWMPGAQTVCPDD
jgi:hypothetical protein